MVTIAFPNSEAFVVTAVACWFLGAVPQPVSSQLPGRELEEIVALADPAVVAGVEPSTAHERWAGVPHCHPTSPPIRRSTPLPCPTPFRRRGRPRRRVARRADRS